MLLQAPLHISCIFRTVNKTCLSIFGLLSGTCFYNLPSCVAEEKSSLLLIYKINFCSLCNHYVDATSVLQRLLTNQ